MMRSIFSHCAYVLLSCLLREHFFPALEQHSEFILESKVWNLYPQSLDGLQIE